jgi:hypothetical protein
MNFVITEIVIAVPVKIVIRLTSPILKDFIFRFRIFVFTGLLLTVDDILYNEREYIPSLISGQKAASVSSSQSS